MARAKREPGIRGTIAGLRPGARRHRREASVRRNSAAAERRDAGWSGPLFWPYAYDSVFDYVFGRSADDSRFWAHGNSNVLDGIFTADSANGAVARSWEAECVSRSASGADALVEHIRQTVPPTDAQRESFDALQAALVRAMDRIKEACPAAQPRTPMERLNLMIARLTAMRQAVITVGTPLRTYTESLSDQQKVAFGKAAPETTGSSVSAQTPVCAPPAADRSGERIGQIVRPTKEQRAALEELMKMSAGFSYFVAGACPAQAISTPHERLEAASRRLNVMRYAAVNVRPVLNRFYNSLTDQQKTRLNAASR